MKRFVSVLLILMLMISTLAISPISVFAEESGEEVADENTSVDNNTSTEDGENSSGEGDSVPDGELTDGETDNEPSEDETDPIVGFFESFLPIDALENLKNALFGFVGQLWAFIQNDETYSNIATAILAILALIAIPIIIGVVVVIYAIIGAMIIFAGALKSVIEMILSMLPSIVQ